MNKCCILGLMLGQVVGDAIGLPYEGLSAKRIGKRGWSDSLKHRFFLGYGMVSDDTEHLMMVGEALIASKEEAGSFCKSLRWKFRWWLIGLPCGVGLATAKSCIKLWLGFKRSGVYSAGNGPAMRSALIGAYFSDNGEKRKQFVRVSTELSHTDPMALLGAELIANLAALFTRSPKATDQEVLDVLMKTTDSDQSGQWKQLLDISPQMDLERFLEMNGCSDGVGGYILDTVSSVIFIGRKYQWAYEESIIAIIKSGGDTDTVAAILGALCGVRNGVEEIPREWIKGVVDYPRGVGAIENLATRIIKKRKPSFFSYCVFVPAILLRNLVFLVIVLIHGLVRVVW